MREPSANMDRAKLLQLPAQLDLGATVALSPENFAYVSGLNIITVNLVRPRLAFAVVFPEADPELVLCSIEASLARKSGWIDTITTYTEFKQEPVEALAAVLNSRGLGSARIGIDLDYLPASAFRLLQAALPNAVFINTTEEVAALRAVKSAEEVKLLEAACRATHKAVLEGMELSHLGDSERLISNRIADGIMRHGANSTLFLVFCSGERAKSIHTLPSDAIPREGEIIRMDVGGRFGSLASDFARTYSAGSPTQMQRETYRALRTVQARTIDALRSGMSGEDVFYLCRDEFGKAGLPFRVPHVGHSFGFEIHETPILRPGEKTVLRPGMTVNIEPVVFDETGVAFHLEDLVEVTAGGARVLSCGLAPEELPIMGQHIAYQ